MLLHFIWVSKGRGFGEGEYISLLSALKNTSYDIRLHTNLRSTPDNPYDPYNLLERYSDKFEIVFTPKYDEETYFGIKMKEITWITDVERIVIPHQYGGMYSDLDIIWFSDLPQGLIEDVDFAISWENKAYKCPCTGWLYMKKGFEDANILIERMKVLAEQIGSGKKNVDKDTHKNFLTFFYVTTNYAKDTNQRIIDKKYFLKNTGRRIGRVLRRMGLPTTKDTDYGSTNDKINFEGSCGFHYYSSMFPYSSIKQLPELKEVLTKILQ